MEYTIASETLVYYALRDPNTGSYWNQDTLGRQGTLLDCTKIGNLNMAKIKQAEVPQFSEIRKVKVIDIGEAIDQ